MGCIGKLTEEYRHRLYDLLALYAKPYYPQEPVTCIDESGPQLISVTAISHCPWHLRPPPKATTSKPVTQRATVCSCRTQSGTAHGLGYRAPNQD